MNWPGRLGWRPGTSVVVVAVAVTALAVTTSCTPTARTHPADPAVGPGPPASPRPPSTAIGRAAGTAAISAPANDAGLTLAGSWVADNGDIFDFVQTTSRTYRGTVTFASECAPAVAAVVVTSQGHGRFTGTGPLESVSAGGCGASRPLAPVAIQVAAGDSTAQVSGALTTAVEVWTRATFAVTGHLAPPGPNDEDQAEGSPALAKTCDRTAFDRDELHGSLGATSFGLSRAATAATLLTHFLGGSGTPIGFPPASPVAAEAVQSSAFLHVDQQVRSYLVGRLDQGQTRIDLDQAQGVLATIDFTDPSISDLYLAFRATQGLDVTGVGAVVGADYVGELTYVIRDAYGFGVHDYLSGIGAEMRYLQTTCGAPFYPGGAHWFPDSVTVTVALRVPVQRRG